MEKQLQKPVNIWLAAAICCLLWGSAFPVIKTGYAVLGIDKNDTPSIILFAGVRFFIAGALTVAVFSIINKKPLVPSRTSLKKIPVLALFQTVIQYIFFYLGLAYTSGDRASVINASGVFFAIFISALIFKFEKLKANKLLGSAVGFIGVILVSLDAFTKSGGGFIGEAFILISSISYAFSSNFIKVYSKDDDPAMLSGWQFMLGGAVLIIAGLILGGKLGNMSLKGAGIILYLAFVSAAAYTLWSILLKYNEVSKVAVCFFMTPVFGCILSVLSAGSGFSSLGISAVALLLVCAGIITVNYSGKNKDKKV